GKEALKVTKGASVDFSAGYLALINEASLQKSDLLPPNTVGSPEIFRDRVREVGINNPMLVRRFVPTILLNPIVDAIPAFFFRGFPIFVIGKAVFRYVDVIDIIDRSGPIIVVRIIEIQSWLFASILIFKDDVGLVTFGTERVHKSVFW